MSGFSSQALEKADVFKTTRFVKTLDILVEIVADGR